MAEEEVTIGLREDFYKDSFGKVIFIIFSILLAIFGFAALSLYMHLNKPTPITFPVQAEWRIQPDVPLNDPYISTADLMQWVSDALSKSFVFDFLRYDNQLKAAQQFFTDNGWKVFLNHLNVYANYNNVQSYKLFVTAQAAGAPILINQGVVSGSYVWCIQMPLTINYAGYKPLPAQTIDVQLRVIRVPTLQNLSGVGIENVIVEKTVDPTRRCLA